MKKIVISIASLAAVGFAFGPAMAEESLTSDVTITGQAREVTHSAPLASALTIAPGDFVETDGTVNETPRTVTIGDVTANYLAVVGVKKTGGFLKNQAAACGGASTTCVRYEADLAWAPLSEHANVGFADIAAGSKDNTSTTASGSGALVLTITPKDDTETLNPGNFVDTVVVHVGTGL